MSSDQKTQLNKLINLNSLNIHQYLSLCKLLTKYYQQVIQLYNNQFQQADNNQSQQADNNQSQQADKQSLDSFINLENQQQDKIKQLLCLKSPEFNEPMSLRIIRFYDHLNETFCSIFESVNDLRSKKDISNRENKLIVDFIQSQLYEIQSSIKQYEKSSHGQPRRPNIQNMDESQLVTEYYSQIQAIIKQYQPLYDLRNQMFRTQEERTRIQLIIKMEGAILKNLQKNSQFFRYKVLGAIPGSIKQQSESQIRPISDIFKTYTDENWEDEFMDTLKNNVQKFKETAGKMSNFIKNEERLVPAKEQLRILSQ